MSFTASTARHAFTATAVVLAAALAGCGTSLPQESLMTLHAVSPAAKATKATTAVKTTGVAIAARPAAHSAAVTPVTVVAMAPAADTTHVRASLTAAPIAPPTGAADRLGKLAAAGAGNVSVAFASLGKAQRHVMSLSDIASVTVTLTAANGVAQTQTLDRAALGAASPSVTFNGVVVGTATLTVTALDASGARLGTASSSAAVQAHQTVAVPLSVHIAANTGSVAANVSFIDDGAAATPGPAEVASPTPTPVATASPWFPVFPSPTPTPTPMATAAPGLPGFLGASAAPVATTPVWGRLYDYSGNQLGAGQVEIRSQDPSTPYDSTVSLRDDGYFYFPDVPTSVTLLVTATSNNLSSQTYSTYWPSGDPAHYEWDDVFVN